MQMSIQAMIMQSQPQCPVPQSMFFQSPQSFSTPPTQQSPYFSSNTTRNSNIANFTSQNLPNSESENEKTYFRLQWNINYIDIKWQDVYFPFLKTFLDT